MVIYYAEILSKVEGWESANYTDEEPLHGETKKAFGGDFQKPQTCDQFVRDRKLKT